MRQRSAIDRGIAAVGKDIDITIENDSTIDELFKQIENLLPKELSVEEKIVLDLI